MPPALAVMGDVRAHLPDRVAFSSGMAPGGGEPVSVVLIIPRTVAEVKDGSDRALPGRQRLDAFCAGRRAAAGPEATRD
jgi:hypothetical protein